MIPVIPDGFSEELRCTQSIELKYIVLNDSAFYKSGPSRSLTWYL